MVNTLSSKVKNEDSDFFKKAIELILYGQFDKAYRMICKRNSEMPFPPGLNCDWAGWWQRGIGENWLHISARSIDTSSNSLITAASIYSLYSGIPSRDVASMLINAYDINYPLDELRKKLRYEESKLSSDVNFSSYEESGIEKYQFLASLDKRTCSICGHLDGKIFLVEDHRVGINCPPMHEGCRCTTVSTIKPEYNDDMTRFARDSEGKGIKVPQSMSWEEWKNQYLTKD